MRIFKIKQTICFKERTDYGMYKPGDVLELSGYVNLTKSTWTEDIFEGYLQEVDSKTGMTFYVKAIQEDYHRRFTMLSATKCSGSRMPMGFCTHIPYFKDEGNGLLDETDGMPIDNGKYFFDDGHYIATTTVSMEEITIEHPGYSWIYTKLNKMLDRYHTALNHGGLFISNLYKRIAPNWDGPQCLIDMYLGE